MQLNITNVQMGRTTVRFGPCAMDRERRGRRAGSAEYVWGRASGRSRRLVIQPRHPGRAESSGGRRRFREIAEWESRGDIRATGAPFARTTTTHGKTGDTRDNKWMGFKMRRGGNYRRAILGELEMHVYCTHITGGSSNGRESLRRRRFGRRRRSAV